METGGGGGGEERGKGEGRERKRRRGRGGEEEGGEEEEKRKKEERKKGERKKGERKKEERKKEKRERRERGGSGKGEEEEREEEEREEEEREEEGSTVASYLKQFSLKMLRCKARVFPVGKAYGYMISQPFFTQQKMHMHMNLDQQFCSWERRSLRVRLLAIGSKYASNKGMPAV